MIKYLKNLDFNICKYNTALFFAATLLLTPVLLLFYKDNGLGVKEFFFFQGLFYFVSILVEIPVGYLADKFSRKTVLTMSFSILVIISLLWYSFNGYWVVLLGEMLFALSKVMRDNASSGYIYDYIKGNNMAKYFGYQNFFLSIGTSLAAVLGTFLYIKFGYKNLLLVGLVLYLISVVLILSLPKVDAQKKDAVNLKEFFKALKTIYENKSIKYYVLYSGFLTALSILFAMSFQPILKNAFFPVAFFGIISFINYGTRTFSGIAAGKFLRNFDVKKLAVPLYFLYFIAFIILITIINISNKILIFTALTTICLVISIQLVFTILHIARLHKFVSIEKRGGLMSVNNIVSKSLSAVILISSRYFISNDKLVMIYIVFFIVFIAFAGFLAYRIKQENTL